MAKKAARERESLLYSSIPFIIVSIVIIIVVAFVFLYTDVISRSGLGSFLLGVRNSINTTLPVSLSKQTKSSADSKTPAESAGVGGLPNLRARALSEGVIVPISGDVISRRTTSPGDLVAVRFEITNTGSAPTGTWYFKAELPTLPAYTYTSPDRHLLRQARV